MEDRAADELARYEMEDAYRERAVGTRRRNQAQSNSRDAQTSDDSDPHDAPSRG